ncbi:hypothetical protein D3C78_646020 [compost metagenome]
MFHHFCRRPSIQHLGGALKLIFTLLATVRLWGAVAFGNAPRPAALRGTPVRTPCGACLGGQIVAYLGLIHTSWIGALTDLTQQS